MSTKCPAPPWVLHVAPLLGGTTDRWIDLQARLSDRYKTRLLGAEIAAGEEVQPHWMTVGQRWDRRVAYEWITRSRGLTGTWFVPSLRQAAPAVLHAHYGPVATSHRLLAQLAGVPLVASFYGYDATKAVFRTDPRWRRQYAKLFSSVAAIVAEGPAMASRVEALGAPHEKVHVVRMPADADGLESCTRPKADDFLVAIAGRYIEKKGFDTAIRAFARAFRGKRNARLLVLGGGEMEHELRQLASSERIGEQVVWKGRLPFGEFMAEISTARLALYPSRTASDGDSEGGAPVTLIEAQWLGVPSIVSDHDDLPFVAAPDGAIVLGALEVERWAEALVDLYSTPQKLDVMAANAERFVKAKHAPAANLSAREAIYDLIT
jgi:colanic acid/amylovoran biosynthesis glycosyltransferase